MSEDEYKRLKAAAEEARATVPWYLVDTALNPPAPAARPGPKGKGQPWLPWPKRRALADAILSGSSMLAQIVLRELSHTGANLNQIARAVNITEVVPEDELPEALEELRETMAEVRDRAERMEAMAKDVIRR